MAQQTFSNVTIRATGSFAPNTTGWDFSALPQFVAVDAAGTLQTADLNDASLTINGMVEVTNDPAGATGWFLLTGGLWQGGPTGRDQTAKQPAWGPYSTTNWPPLQRIR
jgi:hypothetical protein